MKKCSFGSVFALVILLCFGNVFAQKSKTADSLSSPQLENVGSIALRVLGFQDKKVSAVTLGRIADLVWEKDEDYARYLFGIALGKTAIEEKDSPTEINLKNAAFRKVISIIARRDADWTRALITFSASF